MDLKEALKKLPEQPGIYFMRNSLNTVIYVGKAKNLKKRVSQYFQGNRNNSPKIDEMIGHIDSFEYVTTDTELEAFLLECKTIKELQPRYNSQLKNSKGYKYIRLSVNEVYPKLTMVSQQKKDKSLYFGPFSSESCVLNTIQFIKDFYPIRKCSSGALKRNSSGCLNFQLQNCMGPCRGSDISEEYGKQISRIIQLLEGKDVNPLKELHIKMKAASLNMEFEKAAYYRDQIRGLRHILNKQRLIKVSQYGRNIIAAERYGKEKIKLFFIKGNKLMHLEEACINNNNGTELHEKLKALSINYFKVNNKTERLSQENIDEAQIIDAYLRKKGNGVLSIKIPASRIDSMDYREIAKVLLGS